MSDIWIGNCLTCGMPAGACRCVPPPDPRDAELTRLRAQLAAAEQQLTTATALLVECEKAVEEDYLASVAMGMTKEANAAYDLLTRIREATKGTRP